MMIIKCLKQKKILLVMEQSIELLLYREEWIIEQRSDSGHSQNRTE